MKNEKLNISDNVTSITHASSQIKKLEKNSLFTNSVTPTISNINSNQTNDDGICNLETDSIGSAASILFDKKSVGFGQKSTGSSFSTGYTSIDLDNEILVGAEKELHHACKCGDVSTIANLVKSGYEIINCRNKHDRTPLHWASGNGYLEIVKILLDEGASIDAADIFGMDSLLWSAWFGHKNCVQHLLHAGAKSTSRNKHGYTWIHCAIQNNHSNVIELLSEEMQDFDKNIKDNNGRSPLHIACKYGRKEIAYFLIKLGCEPNLKDKLGNTPLHTAAFHGQHQLISTLIDANCVVDDVNNAQLTPLHIAAKEGFADFCKKILEYNVDINCETDDEVSPLHLAVAGGHNEVCELLLHHGADIDTGNKHNQTPLHLAVMNANLELTNILIKCGANACILDAQSETPLHLAAENGLYDISEVLLLGNANADLKDMKGKTPLDVAARGNYVTIVDMIIKAERLRVYLKLPYFKTTNKVVDVISLKPDKNPGTQHFRTILYRLATKLLKPLEWKQLAFFWGFTDRQLQAIEEQYTGSKSYQEHGHRMLLIWLHGCTLKKQNSVKELYEGLLGIQKHDLAELVRTKACQTNETKHCSVS